MNTGTQRITPSRVPFSLYTATAVYIKTPQKKAAISAGSGAMDSFFSQSAAAFSASSGRAQAIRRPVSSVPARFPASVASSDSAYAPLRSSAR